MRTALLKRAQAELIAGVAAVAFLLVLAMLGIAWLASAKQGTAQEEGAEQAVRAARLADITATMAEWQCPPHAGERCIDLSRAGQLGTEYFNVFGQSLVKLDYITPDWQRKTVMLYDARPAEPKSVERHVKFVAARDANGQNLFGALIVEAHQ